MNSPATYSVVALASNALTRGSSSAGAQPVNAPPASNAARPLRAAPAMVENEPPAKSRPPAASSAEMSPSGCGAQAASAPVVASTAARLARGWPATRVNPPPRYSVAPTSASARTSPSVPSLMTAGANAGLTRPSASTWARLARATPPILRNEPPTYQPPAPSGSITRTKPSPTLGKPRSGVPVAASSFASAGSRGPA